jgi:hypothetical protein
MEGMKDYSATINVRVRPEVVKWLEEDINMVVNKHTKASVKLVEVKE